MSTVCDPLFARNFKANKMSGDSKKRPWFDQDCEELRKQNHTDLNNFRLDKTTQNQIKLSQARRNSQTNDQTEKVGI